MKQYFIDLETFPIEKQYFRKIIKDDQPGQEVKRLALEHGVA